MTEDDLSPRPTAAAWVPIDGEARLIVQWIAEHAPDDTYARRALFVPQKRDLDMAERAIQAFGANGNVGSVRNPQISRGGPVLAYRPDVRLLAHAVAAAEGQVLGVIEFSPGEIAGVGSRDERRRPHYRGADAERRTRDTRRPGRAARRRVQRLPPRPRAVLRGQVLSAY